MPSPQKGSIVQSAEQPSPSMLLPSSHSSPSSSMPSPQKGSTVQIAEQPSPSMLLPSSHSSPSSRIPSPQSGWSKPKTMSSMAPDPLSVTTIVSTFGTEPRSMSCATPLLPVAGRIVVEIRLFAALYRSTRALGSSDSTSISVMLKIVTGPMAEKSNVIGASGRSASSVRFTGESLVSITPFPSRSTNSADSLMISRCPCGMQFWNGIPASPPTPSPGPPPQVLFGVPRSKSTPGGFEESKITAALSPGLRSGLKPWIPIGPNPPSL